MIKILNNKYKCLDCDFESSNADNFVKDEENFDDDDYNSEMVCIKCAKEKYTCCEKCNNIFKNDKNETVELYGKHYCDDCYENFIDENEIEGIVARNVLDKFSKMLIDNLITYNSDNCSAEKLINETKKEFINKYKLD